MGEVDAKAVLREHDVFVASDNAFQRRARLLQALWREERGYPAGSYTSRPKKGRPKKRSLGSRLRMPDAETELWNYLTPAIGSLVRAELEANRAVTDSRYKKLYTERRLFEDLLSSQPLCFNLFGELALDLDLATAVGRRLWPDRIDRVTAIRFEYSPGRGDLRYLGNRSAADALIEHTTPTGKCGLIAIETKYHESLGGKAGEWKPRYTTLLSKTGVVRSVDSDLRQGWLQQILLDHLLALSMLEADPWATALFVFAYPRPNERCEEAVAEYQSRLTTRGEQSFEPRTLEQIVDALKSEVNGRWVGQFRRRYLAWDRAETLLSGL